ncbi:NAD-dependent succinate-semialdehyde dehydrogenase [Stappia indica]|uniref:NAD-dependent succinate-semialdehyde dehydrogenase n=1 Tax=Stappia indica TaxID=538381 RepID=UPI001CD47FAE|nr:NAD-dependent succinate-semialdehyde dehydrogenase [Stappia indica]MCA1300192.1 NAD-dependent succinate-semialdehyde dehydrogenase [Stappia indica]
MSYTFKGVSPSPELLRDTAFIAGDWVSAADGRTFAVTDPSCGEIIRHVPDLSREDTRKAIDAAHAAQKLWADETAETRADVLRRFHDLVMKHQEDLARILTAEMGKPLQEARGEITYGASYLLWFAEEARRVYGDTIPAHRKDARIMVLRQPVGVVAAITPWNFPSAMPCRKFAPALAAGCAVVFKPAMETPLSALALAALGERAGLPRGVLSVITTSDSRAFGAEVCENPLVSKLTFTGSTQVGRLLMAQAAPKIMKLSMELGGNAPFIVFDDADVDAAVDGCIQSKFRNNGQTCVCTNRIYVQDGVHDVFVEKLTEAVARLNVGSGMDPRTDLGPLISEAACDKFETHIADAVEKGARILTGAPTRLPQGTFVQPTVLSGLSSDMLVATEETFAPLAPVFRFSDEDEVVRMANDTEFGLASYFYANNLNRVWRVAERLAFGMVGVNTGLISTAVAPFGGIKQSGFGKEGSKYGLDDFLTMKYVCLGGIA